MRHLALRRFRDTITRRRHGPGMRNNAGEYVEGAIVETEFRASVQPLKLTDADIAGGAQLLEPLKVYIPEFGALVAAFEDRGADTVRWNGMIFTVIDSRAWHGGHTRATILRET